jgi:phosphonate degradation associated HDIG domain protein
VNEQALNDLEAVARLYAERGGAHYGEGVSLLEHALQSAVLAESSGAPAALIAAALLHDIGHLVGPDDPSGHPDLDAHHERLGDRALSQLFGEAVRAPIRLHVTAKRYLCFTEPAYVDSLSEASRLSLALQGGVLSADQAASFERLAHWREAVALRRFDDLAKRTEPCGRSLEDFLPLLRTLSAHG